MQRSAFRIGSFCFILVLLFLVANYKGYAQTQSMPIVQENVTYDELTNRYLIHTIVGGQEMEVPIVLTPAEYMEWSMRKSMQAYYKRRNDSIATQAKDKLAFTILSINHGQAEKKLGPGGVQSRPPGTA